MLIGMIEAAIKMKMALPGNKTVEESENIRYGSILIVGNDYGNVGFLCYICSTLRGGRYLEPGIAK